MILLAIVDADYMFTYIDVSGKCSSSNAQIYSRSDLHSGLVQTGFKDFLSQTPYLMTSRICRNTLSKMMPPHSRLTSWNMATKTSLMKSRYSTTTGCPEKEGSWFRVLLTTMKHHHKKVRIIAEACCIHLNLMLLLGMYRIVI